MRAIMIVMALLVVLSLAGWAAAASAPEKFELGQRTETVLSQQEAGRGGLEPVPYERMSPEKFDLTHREAAPERAGCRMETGRGGLSPEHARTIEKWQF